MDNNEKKQIWYEKGLHQNRYWSYDAIHDFSYHALAEVDKLCKKHGLHYCLAYGTVLGAVRDHDIIPWDPDADIYVPAQEMKTFIDIARKEFPNDLYIDCYDNNQKYIYTHAKIGKTGFTSNGLHIDVFPLVALPAGKKQETYLRKYDWKCVWFRVIQGNPCSQIKSINAVCVNKVFRRSIPIIKKFLNKDKIIREMENIAARYSLSDEKNCEFVFDGFRVFPAAYFRGEADCELHGMSLKIPYDSHSYLQQSYGDYMQYPSDRCFQSLVRSDSVNDACKYMRTAFISSFQSAPTQLLIEVEKLYWESGSVVGVVDLEKMSPDEQKKAIVFAKSIKYFDKVINSYDGEQNLKHILELIAPDHVVRY